VYKSYNMVTVTAMGVFLGWYHAAAMHVSSFAHIKLYKSVKCGLCFSLFHPAYVNTTKAAYRWKKYTRKTYAKRNRMLQLCNVKK
jgi:hypothetical protein